jgi:hypothetical protein
LAAVPGVRLLLAGEIGQVRDMLAAIDRVAIDVSGEPYLDLEREAALMLMRE